MRCVMCGGHATFLHTIFEGANPHKVNLCDPCAQKAQANEHMAKIKAAPDREAKSAAVQDFLKAIGKAEG
jgi:protein-arginine kinase activator protein McsA